MGSAITQRKTQKFVAGEVGGGRAVQRAIQQYGKEFTRKLPFGKSPAAKRAAAAMKK